MDGVAEVACQVLVWLVDFKCTWEENSILVKATVLDKYSNYKKKFKLPFITFINLCSIIMFSNDNMQWW